MTGQLQQLHPWTQLIDTSVALGIAAAAGYMMFRLFDRTETHRRAQAMEMVKFIIEALGSPHGPARNEAR